MSVPLDRRTLLGGSAAAFAAAALPAALRAQAVPQPLRLNIFGGTDAWPVYVIAAKRLLEPLGYAPSIVTTGGSVAQFQALQSGSADLALTALDNVVAYDEGQGDPAVTGTFDGAAFLGISSGSLALLVRPDVTSYAQLRGATLAVDAPNTGFSFVLRRMLQNNGIAPGGYSFAAVGNTQKRFDAMVAGQAAGAVVSTPFDLLGVQKYGFHVLGTALSALGHYQATVMAAQRSWLAAHAAAAAAFVRAYRGATAWLADPANHTEAAAILTRGAELPPDVVAQIAPRILADPNGFSRSGAFDMAGVATVLSMREAYAVPPKKLRPPQAYLDPRFL